MPDTTSMDTTIINPRTHHGNGVPTGGGKPHRHAGKMGWYDHYHPPTSHGGQDYFLALNNQGDEQMAIQKAAPKTKTATVMTSVEDAVDALNSMLQADPEAVSELMATRVVVNDAMTEHPTAQVGPNDEDLDADGDPNSYVIGLLGLINGIFGIREDGYGHITASWNDEGDTVTLFEVTTDEMVAEATAE